MTQQKPIRILLPFIGGSHLGGSHLSALGLIRGLDRSRYEPVVLLHDPTGPFAELLTAEGIGYEALTEAPIMGLPGDRDETECGLGTYLTRTLPLARRTLKALDIDIVHTNDGRMHVNWSLPTRLAGRKLLWHHRQDPGAFGVNKIAPLLANQIASVSYFSKPSKPVRNVDDRFTVVRSPFTFTGEVPDKTASHKMICDELSLPENAVLLGYFGILNQRKRVLHFVRAVAAIRAAYPERQVHGLVFGKPEDPAEGLDAQAEALAGELGISEAYHMMGFRKPIDPYMAGIDVMLVPALSEPFGRTLIESMHLGTPVVATDHGGNPEAIEDGVNGFLVATEPPEAFVAPVLKLLNDPARCAEIVAAARQNIDDLYGEARHIREVSALYDKLAKR